MSNLHIAMGVTQRITKMKVQEIKVLCLVMLAKKTEELMPAPIYFSHKILRLIAADRKNGSLKGIEPDSKSQVSMLYENDKPVKVTSVVISTQHSKDLNQKQVRDLVIPYIKESIPQNYLEDLIPEEIYINPTGQFIIGGPDGRHRFNWKKNYYVYLWWSSPTWRRSFSERTQQK